MGKTESCTDCGGHISIRYTPSYVKKQREQNAKDIIQPYKYDKQEKKMIPNKAFEQVYGKQKAARFAGTIQGEAQRLTKNQASTPKLTQ